MSHKYLRLNSRTIIKNTDCEVLLLKRSMCDTDRPGSWDLPGGKLKFGEHPKDTALRETVEETGLLLGELMLLDVLSATNNKNFQKITHVFLSNLDELHPEISLNEREHTEYDWYRCAEIESLDLPRKYTKLIGEVILPGCTGY